MKVVFVGIIVHARIKMRDQGKGVYEKQGIAGFGTSEKLRSQNQCQTGIYNKMKFFCFHAALRCPGKCGLPDCFCHTRLLAQSGAGVYGRHRYWQIVWETAWVLFQFEIAKVVVDEWQIAR